MKYLIEFSKDEEYSKIDDKNFELTGSMAGKIEELKGYFKTKLFSDDLKIENGSGLPSDMLGLGRLLRGSAKYRNLIPIRLTEPNMDSFGYTDEDGDAVKILNELDGYYKSCLGINTQGEELTLELIHVKGRPVSCADRPYVYAEKNGLSIGYPGFDSAVYFGDIKTPHDMFNKGFNSVKIKMIDEEEEQRILDEQSSLDENIVNKIIANNPNYLICEEKIIANDSNGGRVDISWIE